MGMEGMTTTTPSGQGRRPTWQVALVALVVLFVISELTYLVVGMVAKAAIAGGATAHDGIPGALANALFIYADSDAGAPVFAIKSYFGLPGFNNLYFLVFGPFDTTKLMPFITSGLAAPLVGMMALFGHLTLTAGRNFAVSVLSAALLAVGWVVLYASAEASMYGDDLWSNFSLHYLEIPVAFVSLLAVSLVIRVRG